MNQFKFNKNGRVITTSNKPFVVKKVKVEKVTTRVGGRLADKFLNELMTGLSK